MRVAMLQEIISPYRIPVFNRIAQTHALEFKVFFLSETQTQRQWPVYWNEIHFPYEIIPGVMFEGKNLRNVNFNFGILSRLFREKFDVIVTGGWHQPGYYLCLLYAKLFRKKFLLWSESTALDSRKTSFLPEALRKNFVRQASGAIAAGKASRDYLVSLGVNSDRVWTAPNAVDNNYYAERSAPFRANKQQIKRERGFPEKLVLYAGRMVPEKGIYTLLRAYARISVEMKDVGLILCGEGEDRPSLEAACKSEGLVNVFFVGFVDRENMPFYYGIADLLVLPSFTEPWGLVINEAMACGLPVLATTRAGAARDLVRSGENGYTFEPGDASQLFGLMKLILRDGETLRRYGKASSLMIQNFTPDICAAGFLRAVREA